MPPVNILEWNNTKMHCQDKEIIKKLWPYPKNENFIKGSEYSSRTKQLLSIPRERCTHGYSFLIQALWGTSLAHNQG